MMLLGLIECFVVLNAGSIIWTRLKGGETESAHEHNLIVTVIMVVVFLVFAHMEIGLLKTEIPEGQYSAPITAAVQTEAERVTVDGVANIEIQKVSDVDGNTSYVGYVTDIYVEGTSITTDHFWHEFNFEYDPDLEMRTGRFQIEDDDNTYYIDVASDEINHDSLGITINDVLRTKSIWWKIGTILFVIANAVSIVHEVKTWFKKNNR